jgi:SAM-dependent methyltransferase
MGIDIQALKLLRHAKDKGGDFKRTLTIGRQGVHCPKHAVEIILNNKDYQLESYCETLFQTCLGSTSVDSIDVSTYEKATIIHDLNLAFNYDGEKFDTIFDGGCLEHIYNIPEALKNLSKLCKIGGQILHVLPTNNQCGHGFWQISPELFFTLYSEKNGYSETEVLLGDTTDPNWTYKIDPPPTGKRHDIQHPNPLYVMVRTVLKQENFNHTNIQQSDYILEWEKNE